MPLLNEIIDGLFSYCSKIIGEDATAGIFRSSMYNLVKRDALPKDILGERAVASLDIREFLRSDKLSYTNVCIEFLFELRSLLIRNINEAMAKRFMNSGGILAGMKEPLSIQEVVKKLEGDLGRKTRLKKENEAIYVTLEEGSPLATRYGESKSETCEFLAGFIQGAMGTPYLCREIECKATGKKDCVFEIFRPRSSAELFTKFI